MSCSTVLPALTSVVSRVRRSVTLLRRAAFAICAATCWNCSFLATKSVSQFSSTRTPACVPSSSAVTSPLPAVRVARLVTSLAPLRRRISTAASRSPLASVSAFLQSIIPAPVCSRSRFTSAAEIFAMLWFLVRLWSRLVVGWSARRRSLVVADAGYGVDFGVGYGIGLGLGDLLGDRPGHAYHVGVRRRRGGGLFRGARGRVRSFRGIGGLRHGGGGLRSGLRGVRGRVRGFRGIGGLRHGGGG